MTDIGSPTSTRAIVCPAWCAESHHAVDIDGYLTHWGRATSFAGPAVRDGSVTVQLVVAARADGAGSPAGDNPIVASIGDVIHTPLTLPVAARLARHILELVEVAEEP